VLFIAAAAIAAIPVLWALSVGAMGNARRARERDPRRGCQAWVAITGLGDRRYRCCEPRYAGGPWCRRHEVAHRRGELELAPDAALIDEPQEVGRSLVQARIGVPLAVLYLLGVAASITWLVR
jgi:hypothetical protein